jgi:hypothetical protein
MSAAKERFHQKLGENLLRKGVVNNKTPEGAVRDGLREAWLCEWPDCRRRRKCCGGKYGCAMIPTTEKI